MGCCASAVAAPPLPSVPEDRADGLAWQREEDFLALYEELGSLGEGAMGTVSKVRKRTEGNRSLAAVMQQGGAASASAQSLASLADREREKLYAMKTIHVGRVSREDLRALKNEIELLRTLDHPNIIHMNAVVFFQRRIYMIMELCGGGHLSKSKSATYTEARICHIVQQMLRGLAYMHARSICHNDLKAENVCFATSEPHSAVKLIDFGLSQRYSAGEYMKKVCGTMYTMAPEVHFAVNGYTLMADLWSVGCLLYLMLSKGDYPFLEDVSELQNEAKVETWKNAKFTCTTRAWDAVSAPAKELLANLLKKKPQTRWTAAQALRFVDDTWAPIFPSSTSGAISKEAIAGLNVAASTDSLSGLRPTVSSMTLDALADFADYGELRKNVLMVAAFSMDRNALHELSQDFVAMDTARNGTLTFDEFRRGLQEHGVAEAELRRVFESVDMDGSGRIRYREFLAATVEALGFVEEEALADAFDRIDSDNSGFISRENLRGLLGDAYQPELVAKMMDEACGDSTSDQINFEQFLVVMRKQKRESLDPVRLLEEEEDEEEEEGQAGAPEAPDRAVDPPDAEESTFSIGDEDLE